MDTVLTTSYTVQQFKGNTMVLTSNKVGETSDVGCIPKNNLTYKIK